MRAVLPTILLCECKALDGVGNGRQDPTLANVASHFHSHLS